MVILSEESNIFKFYAYWPNPNSDHDQTLILCMTKP